LLGLVSAWLSLVYILSGLVVFWDWKIGWRGWSLDYAVPILCVAALLVMYITAKVMRLARDYISYFLLGGLFGIVPVPSLVSVAASIIFLAAIIIFQGDSIKEEFKTKVQEVFF